MIFLSEIVEQLKTNPEMKNFFNDCFAGGAIRLRDSLFGGRTEVFKMHLEEKEGWEIKYLDVTSLYPYVLFSKDFPVSQPICHVN